MNVLLLAGSPRGDRSLSLGLARTFVEGLRESRAEVRVTEVSLVGADIHPCTGCFSCWRKTPGQCVFHDAMDDLLPRFLAADLVVWAFPLYHFGMPTPVRRFVERTLPLAEGRIVPAAGRGFAHPPRHRASGGVRHLVVSTCGFPSIEGNYEALFGHADALWGPDGWDRIVCTEGELLEVAAMGQVTGPYRTMVRQAGAAWSPLSPTPIPRRLRDQLDRPMMPPEAFLKLANLANAPGGFPEPEPEGSPAEAAPPVDAVIEGFLKQMVALYDPRRAPNDRTVFELGFTDTGAAWQIICDGSRAELQAGGTEPADVTARTTWSDFQNLAAGRAQGPDVLKMGGRTELMLLWSEGLFGGPGQPAPAGREPPPLPLGVGLAPWILGWVLVSLPVPPAVVAFGPLLAAAAIGAWTSRRRRTTWLEAASPLALGVWSWVVLALVPDRPAASALAYLLSAAVWALSLVPGAVKTGSLTAEYSAVGRPASIVGDPLFRAVNRHLTGFWAGLFAAQAGASAWLLTSPVLGPWSSLILQAALVPAGWFTAWYPGWAQNRSAAQAR